MANLFQSIGADKFDEIRQMNGNFDGYLNNLAIDHDGVKNISYMSKFVEAEGLAAKYQDTKDSAKPAAKTAPTTAVN